MTHRLTVAIAGVEFEVYSPAHCLLPQHGYAAFQAAGTAEREVVDVMLRVGESPAWARLPALFDNGPAWVLERSGDQYCVRSQGLEVEAPYWQAWWTAPLTHVDLYCDRALLTTHAGAPAIADPVAYPLDQFLFDYYLAPRQGVLVHAAGVQIAGSAFIFPGTSGAGKSTLSRQFLARQWPTLFSDDRMAVRKRDGVFHAYGTPWPGDAKIAVNAGAPLKGIFFILHGPENSARELTPREALTRLMPVASILWFDPDAVVPMLDCCDDLLRTVPAFELQCRPAPEVVDYLDAFVARHL